RQAAASVRRPGSGRAHARAHGGRPGCAGVASPRAARLRVRGRFARRRVLEQARQGRSLEDPYRALGPPHFPRQAPAAPPLHSNSADDATPRISPDGKQLAWRAQARSGYESDRFRLMVMDWPRGSKPREVSPGWDHSVKDFAWARDGQSLWIIAENGTHVTL